MISAQVFYERQAVCTACGHWKGVCLKGHGLASPLGCPEQKFHGVEGAGYLEDRPAAKVEISPASPCCGGAAPEVKELTYAEAAQEFVRDMKAWRAAGYPMVTDAQYTGRVDICKTCPGGFYRWFQCRACKCFIFSKAKLATTFCPGGYWPPV
jgi:hypothetical protein